MRKITLVGLLALVFLAHAFVYAGVLWLLAFAIARALGRLAPGRLATVTLAALAIVFDRGRRPAGGVRP